MKIYKYFPVFLQNYATFCKTGKTDEAYKGFKLFARTVDMLHCYLHYKVLPTEYDFYKFYNLRDCYRKNYLVKYDQYITYLRFNKTIAKKGEEHGKDKQYKLFGKDLIKRDFICLEDDSKKLEQIKEFIKGRKKVVFKPCQGSLGAGVFVYENNGDEKELYEAYIKTLGRKYLCEDYIVQHHELAEMHSDSVNTARIVTLNEGGNIKIISATLKIGIGDCVVDNIRHEGLGATIDIESGIVCTPAYDFYRNKYYFHPESNKKIIGFEVPNFDEVKRVATEGAKKAYQATLIGWDIAVTEEGACIIELNNTPGTMITQMYDMAPKGKPVFDYIRENKIPDLPRKRKRALYKKKFKA
ncbi:MAG: hypothetical protein MJ090_03215 [Clostridia bacterium]|nr:hypothetical protein [Clostridia bacterium]